MPEITEVLHDIPVEYRHRFQVLLGREPVATSILRDILDQYIQTVRKVGPLVAFINVEEAELLSTACLALLDHVGRSDSPDEHALVQAAVHYFILEEEDEEVTEVLGFDDDIQVINAILRAAGRDDLIVPLHRPE